MATKKKNTKRAEPTIPETLNTPEFTAAWAEWLRFTEERGMPLADDDAARQLKLLAKLGPEKAIADIHKTMQDHPLKDRVPAPAEVAKKGKGGEKAEKKMPTDDAAKKDSAPAKPAKERKAKAPKEPKDKKMSAIDAAAKVLEEKGEAMNCQEMIEAMAAKGYWSSPGGQTPAATLYSAILRETGKKGSEARFKKASRGRFERA
jgi:hypothetical protein